MMKLIKGITITLFAVSLLAFGGQIAYNKYVADRQSPVITADSQVLDVKMGVSDEELLSGITAHDNRDGDLTKQVLVQGVSQLVTDDTAIVTYVVFDSSNNMGTLKRTIHYTNYAKPHFIVKKPLFYPPNTLITITDRISASDISGKDLSDNVHVVAQNVQKNMDGRYSITVQVSNDIGDYESVQLPLVISQKYGSSQPIALKQYLVYLKTGDSFNPTDYIKSVDEKAGGMADVTIHNDVNTYVAGTYEVSYNLSDCTVFLTVVVR